MKKLIISLFLIVPLFAKQVNTMTVEESFTDFDVEVKICRVHSQRYVLIVNKAENVLKSVLVTETKNTTARNVYGDILLKYYNVKHKKTSVYLYGDDTYTKPEDNSGELFAFLVNLTDMQALRHYPSFSWIDNNSGKREKVEDEEEIGNSAGYFARIGSDDYLDYLEVIK